VLDAKDKSFAAKLFSDAEMADSVKGPSQERGFASQATNLRIWDKSGRLAAGLSWSSYVTDQWDDGGGLEKLTLVFASRYVVLFGHHLLALVRQIDEGRLKSITELDGLQAQELIAENASIRDEGKKIPIVTRFEIGPGIDELVSAIKGEEDDETRYPRRVK
jgi:hypothetical protein